MTQRAQRDRKTLCVPLRKLCVLGGLLFLEAL